MSGWVYVQIDVFNSRKSFFILFFQLKRGSIKLINILKVEYFEKFEWRKLFYMQKLKVMENGRQAFFVKVLFALKCRMFIEVHNGLLID